MDVFSLIKKYLEEFQTNLAKVQEQEAMLRGAIQALQQLQKDLAEISEEKDGEDV